MFTSETSRRTFIKKLAALGITVSASPFCSGGFAAEPQQGTAFKFTGPWAFSRPKPGIILVSDQQLEDLQNPDKELDLSLSSTPNLTTLRKICQSAQAQGARTVILAFDEFWSQYRPGQGGKPRRFLPDTDEYLKRLGAISETLKGFGLGLELSLLSPLEIGRGYQQRTGEHGQWVQYREGYRDPKTGKYVVALWEQQRWTNNKGTIEPTRLSVRVLAFREQRVGRTSYYAVDPAGIVDLPSAPEIEVDESSVSDTHSRRMTVRGQGDTDLGALDRVLVIVRYATPELDYFSPKARAFLEDLVQRYHAAGVPLNGLYADEMHIQQNWGYFSHHDEGQFTFRFLTPSLARAFGESYGQEFADLEKYLVYFAYGQHGFLPNLDARLPAQHVIGADPVGIQRTFLLRRRYYDLLDRTVVGLFADAKAHAEKLYGQELEARAHATWAQSPTIDLWRVDEQALAPRQYEYTPDFVWSNTVQQASAACSDYFSWNAFLTGGGNDHAEGGWLDRNYYGVALACSTGILNKVPYAYAAAWGMPNEVHDRHQAVCNAFGASAHPWFQAVQDSQHRDIDVLMLYPLSLVACEERFGSWMVQYGYANYVTPRVLLERGRIVDGGVVEMAGRKFRTIVVLFEPFPPAELLVFLRRFVDQGGKVIWSGPPPRLDFAGSSVLERWQAIFGVKALRFGLTGKMAPGRRVSFAGTLGGVPEQRILTDFLVDLTYPIESEPTAEVVARVVEDIVGTHRRTANGGSACFLGFRPRDDQAASLGEEVRTWFETLRALGAYPGSFAGNADHPAVVSRTSPYVACGFPNGTTALAPHYRQIVECWPGGFHRDAKQDQEILKNHPLPSGDIQLRDFHVNGHAVTYTGELAVAFRQDPAGRLIAFAGNRCRSITIDGKDFVFATKEMGLAAWAPLLPERRVPGGAVVELWVSGDGRMQVPLPEGTNSGVLHRQGERADALGEKMESAVENGLLTFETESRRGLQHLFFVPKT